LRLTETTADDKATYLRAHLEARYGGHVDDLTRLDRGVFSMTFADGRRWVARVFLRRPVAQVEGDAAVLRFLAAQGYPAERCADDEPVSVLAGRGVLVTEYIEGATISDGVTESTVQALGDLLGRLHALPSGQGAIARAAGALHHYAPDGGGPEGDLRAATSWLAAIADRVPRRSRAVYESLRERLASADTCHDLPDALIHPDPVVTNVLLDDQGAQVFIDWTGAGRGPRLASLAVLIWSCALKSGGWLPQRVDAVVNGYCAHVRLEDRELARLADVLRIRPLVFACWRFRHAVMAGRAPNGSEWSHPDDDLPLAIAARVQARVQAVAPIVLP